MKVSGTSHLTAERERVWEALTDPGVLVRTIPGCQRLEAIGDDAYAMTISAGVASIKGVYAGEVRLTDQHQPGSFRLHAQGAGAPGTIGANVMVRLSDGADGGTDLSYDADAIVGGMIGGVGQRMLAGVSTKMAAEFFGNVNALLTGAPTPTAAPGGRTGGRGPAVDGSGSRATEEQGRMDGHLPSGSPIGAGAGQVYTAPTPQAAAENDFLKGVLVGAALVLAGVVVGGVFGRRRA